uniref:KRAB-A domain-containing protein 2 n=1 Tax=Melanaphis sacchari TaxID=742174 RepID=A0A2H8TQZ8_9HEMI
MESRFYEHLNKVIETKKTNSTFISKSKYYEIINDLKQLKLEKKTNSKLMKKYDVMTVQGEEKLIMPITAEGNCVKLYAFNEELFEIVHEIHLSIGHGGRNRMEYEINKKFKNITRETIMSYLNFCESCERKGNTVKKGLVVKPIVSSEMNSRCQVDLIDMQAQPDGDYTFICVYQDHLTKFVILRPLKHKSAEAIANVLLDIFTLFGAPAILQSDNGREFVNKIISELCTMWKDLKIVHGKPRHSQSQGSVERANQDVENMLATWLQDNKTKKWSNGLRFVQLMKNRAYHHGTKHSPYEAMFGTPPKIGLTSSLLSANIIAKLKTEEELQVALESIQILSNDNESNEVEKEDNEDKVIEKQTKTRQTSINQNRKESLNNLKIQAKKMMEMSEKRFCQGNIGESVRIKIPDVDRARSDLRCVLGVIMSSNNIIVNYLLSRY